MNDIKKYDENGNLIYEKDIFGYEFWHEYDRNNNNVYSKNSIGMEFWQEYDKENRIIYWKNNLSTENWWRYNKNGEKINITKQKKQQKEFLSRKYCSRFELMDI